MVIFSNISPEPRAYLVSDVEVVVGGADSDVALEAVGRRARRVLGRIDTSVRAATAEVDAGLNGSARVRHVQRAADGAWIAGVGGERVGRSVAHCAVDGHGDAVTVARVEVTVRHRDALRRFYSLSR